MPIEITGVEVIQAQLLELSKKTANMTPILAGVGNILKNSIEDSFPAQKSPFGAPWKPSYRVATTGGHTLVKSGTLSSTWNIRANATSVTVGTNVPYAAIHQFGGVIRPKNGKILRFKGSGGWVSKKEVVMPARPFLPIDSAGRLAEGVKVDIMEYLSRKLSFGDT
jgi:phage virion morphogenesis protein